MILLTHLVLHEEEFVVEKGATVSDVHIGLRRYDYGIGVVVT
jgi:hypothetical protein